MKTADLHIHTRASDGLLSAKEVVGFAYRKNLSAISITDHDTVSGIDEAIRCNLDKNILEIIPGIELSSNYNNVEVHILGYYIDYKNPDLLKKLDEIQDARYNRAIRIIERLKKFDVKIDIGEIKNVSKGKSIGRPHIAQLMVMAGYVKNSKEAFDNYIGNGKKAYIERYKLKAEEAIHMIKSTGGIAVLAHPGLISNKLIISPIIDLGIQGIEVYHPKHSKGTVEALKAIAREKSLIITGGSDCHGVLINNEPTIGSVTVDYENVLLLKEALV